MPNTVSLFYPSYIPEGDRVDHLRRPIDQTIGQQIFESIRGELPKLMLLTMPEFCRVLFERHDAILDLPPHKRYDMRTIGDETVRETPDDEMVTRAALATRPSLKHSQPSSATKWRSRLMPSRTQRSIGPLNCRP